MGGYPYLIIIQNITCEIKVNLTFPSTNFSNTFVTFCNTSFDYMYNNPKNYKKYVLSLDLYIKTSQRLDFEINHVKVDKLDYNVATDVQE